MKPEATLKHVADVAALCVIRFKRMLCPGSVVFIIRGIPFDLWVLAYAEFLTGYIYSSLPIVMTTFAKSN